MWDFHYPKRPVGRERTRFMKLCQRLNHERRSPYPNEWDFIIDYSYPEEDRILDMFDNPRVKLDEEKVKVWDHTFVNMMTGETEEVYRFVPLSEKEDYT